MKDDDRRARAFGHEHHRRFAVLAGFGCVIPAIEELGNRAEEYGGDNESDDRAHDLALHGHIVVPGGGAGKGMVSGRGTAKRRLLNDYNSYRIAKLCGSYGAAAAQNHTAAGPPSAPSAAAKPAVARELRRLVPSGCVERRVH